VSSSGSGERRSAPAEQHLGDRLAAFVDGELTDDSRDRVLAHLATCPQCKAAAAEQRRLKSVVAACELPAISAGLLARLQSLPGIGNGSSGPPDDRESGADSAAAGAEQRRGPFDGGLLGTGVFGTSRREEFTYLGPARDLLAAEGSRARGFRIHEPARAASGGTDQQTVTSGGTGAVTASRGRRFAFAAAGAFSLAAIAIGGALPMEAVSDGAVLPEDGVAVTPFMSPFSANQVSDTHGVVPRGALGVTPEVPQERPQPRPPEMASATSVALTRPLLAPGAGPATPLAQSGSRSYVLH
jgi:hypothetical protein